MENQQESKIEIARQFVARHQTELNRWSPKLINPSISDDDALLIVYNNLDQGEYGQVEDVDDQERCVEIDSSQTRSGNPEFFYFEKID